jgi:hypothetical protein
VRTEVRLRGGDVIGIAVHDGEFRLRNPLLPRPYGIDRAEEASSRRDEQHRAAERSSRSDVTSTSAKLAKIPRMVDGALSPIISVHASRPCAASRALVMRGFR